MARTIGSKKPGRTSFGERVPTMWRPPKEHREFYDELAHQLGDIPLSSYITLIMAQHHGLDVPAYVTDELERARVKQEQDQLEFEMPRAG